MTFFEDKAQKLIESGG